MEQEKLEKILNRVADIEGLKNYEIFPHINVSRGNGFFSESYSGDVVDKNTGRKIAIYIKIPPLRPPEGLATVFINEYHFYMNIVPELEKFQKSKNLKKIFPNIPKGYCGNVDPDGQYIAMENLIAQNYQMHGRSQFLSESLLKQLFQLYGKFHAITFAFKDQHFQEYSKLVEPLEDVLFKNKKSVFFAGIKSTFTCAYLAVKDIDPDVAKKIKPYVENFDDNYSNLMTYNGKYSTLTHGDCWSNNMLFKYREDGRIENIKMLDFQISRDSSPVHDLSYFFYSGGSKEDFKKLDEYLDLYHKSFSSLVKELGSDPEKLLPLSVLKLEWKKNSFLGIFMALFAWELKLLTKDQAEEITTTIKSQEEIVNIFKPILESDVFKKTTSDILLHAAEYGIF